MFLHGGKIFLHVMSEMMNKSPHISEITGRHSSIIHFPKPRGHDSPVI